MALDEAKAFIDAVERLAFSMPAPNSYTPQFMLLCVEARRLLNKHQAALTEKKPRAMAGL
jgi:hypothetical protein